MFPYQITQALADQHIRDLQTDARRHRQAAEARLAGTNAAHATNASSRVTAAVAHLRALVLGRQGADTRSTTSTTSQASGAGPMGCIA